MVFEFKSKSGASIKIGIDKPGVNVNSKEYFIKPNELYIKDTKIENLTFCRFCHKYNGTGKDAEKLFALELSFKTAKEAGKVIGTKLDTFCIALNKEIEDYVDSLKPLGEEMLKQALEDEEKPLRELDKKMTNDTIIRVSGGNGWYVRFEHNSPRAKELGMKLNQFYEKVKFTDLFKEYMTEYDLGDYSITYEYEMPLGTLLEKIEEIKKLYEEKIEKDNVKKAEHEAKIKAIQDVAKEKGEKQEVHRWSEPCNDKKEECNVDICVEYAMPDGTFKVERYHTW